MLPLGLLVEAETSATGCWEWTGRLDRYGYGRISRARSLGVSDLAHRAMYQLLVGPIPEGLEIDHLCHTQDASCEGGVLCRHRRCINPAHLEVVTKRENALRGRGFVAGNALKTHCPAGHPYDATNTYVYAGRTHTRRCCRPCNAAAQARRAS